MNVTYRNKKKGVPLTVTLANGSMINFIAGKHTTDDEKVQRSLDRHPNYGRLFERDERPEVQEESATTETPELQPVDHVTSTQLAAEWLSEQFALTGITSKAKAQKAAADNGYFFPNL